MGKKLIGKLLKSERKKQKVSMEVLGEGLCSPATISRIEKGDIMPDRFLLEALLERIGKSSVNLEMVFSQREYDRYYDKRKLATYLYRGEHEAARKMLNKMEGRLDEEDVLYKQYYCYGKGVLEFCCKNLDESIKLLTEAYRLTHKETSMDPEKVRLDFQEINILIGLIYTMRKSGKKKQAEKEIALLEDYVDKVFVNISEKVRVLPAVCYCRVLGMELKSQSDEIRCMCEEMIDLLVEGGYLSYLPEFFERYLQTWKGDSDTLLYRQKKLQYKALKETIAEAEQKENTIYLPYIDQTRIYIADELIQYGRRKKGMTEETLSEGIVEPESLSRIVTGKSTPSEHHLKEIFFKLEINRERIDTAIETDLFECLELKWKVEGLFAVKKYRDAYYALKKLRKKLNMDSIINKQYIETVETACQIIFGEIEVEEGMRRCRKALMYTRKWEIENLSLSNMSRNEADIINIMAILYHRSKDLQFSVYLLKTALASLEDTEVDPIYFSNNYTVMAFNLSTYLEEAKEFDEGIFYCKKGIEISIRSGKYNSLPEFAGNMATLFEKRGKNNGNSTDIERSKMLLIRSYYLSLLRKDNRNLEVIKNYYESKYGEFIW